MYNRISNREVEAKVTTAAAAAQLIKDGMTVGMSGRRASRSASR